MSVLALGELIRRIHSGFITDTSEDCAVFPFLLTHVSFCLTDPAIAMFAVLVLLCQLPVMVSAFPHCAGRLGDLKQPAWEDGNLLLT